MSIPTNHTRRIISRIGLAPDSNSYIVYQALFMDNLPADAGLFNEYHALLVCLAKDACRSHPLCQRCCLNGICHFYLLAQSVDSDKDTQSQG